MAIIEKKHIIPIFIGIVILILSIIFLRKTPFLVVGIVAAVLVAASRHMIDFFASVAAQREIERNFPEFVRDVVGAVKSGMPISKSIIHVADTDYGALSPYVKKLGNQLEWSIPLHKALKTFANSTNNKMIKRAIATVIEAEQSGGNIAEVLETITESLIQIKKIRQSRQATIQGQLIQSYVIFFIFLIVMIVIQNVLIPYVGNIGASGDMTAMTGMTAGIGMTQKVTIDYSTAAGFLISVQKWMLSTSGVFLMLSVIQGLFAGLIIGKLSEGDVRGGVKHSIILMTIAIIIMSVAQGMIAT